MDKTKFINATEDLSLLAEISLEDLQSITEAFPYYNVAQMLLAKKMHVSNHLHFNSQLKSAAISAPSRKALYELIFQEQLQQKIGAVIDDSTDELEELAVTTEPANIAPINFSTIEISEEVETAEEVSESKLNEESESEEKEIRDLKGLEGQVLQEAIKISHEQVILQQDVVESESAAEELEAPAPEGKNLNDWLLYLNKSNQSSSKSKSQIIDDFIKEEPQISRPSKNDLKPSETVRLSITDNDEFVTETLAQIFKKQGNIQKAKSIYEKLMLKNPDKRTYFAALIKKLEEN